MNPLTASSQPDRQFPRHRGDFLKALADFQTELFRVEAGFIPGIRRWELKRALAGLVFRDARKVQDLRTRCRELGVGTHAVHHSATIRGRELVERLCHAPDAESGIRALFTFVKPALLTILKQSVRDDLRIFDAPSVPLLEDGIQEIERQLAWAQEQPEFTCESAPSWLDEIDRLASQLSDTLAGERIHSAPSQKTGRRIGLLPILRSSIPDGFQECLSGTPAPAEESSYEDRALYRAHNFLMEIQASESCASLLFEAPDMPWEFYFDLSRHMWDEMRHSEFGEIKLTALGRDIREMGISNTAYVMRQTLDPLDRYTALTTQEADAFPGKHAGLKDALAHNDEISARAWSYDIADETQHVRYGHKWIPMMIEEIGEPRSYDQLKRNAENWRRDVLAPVYSPSARSFAEPMQPQKS